MEDNAWLRLGDINKLDIKNPLADFDEQRPGYAEIKLMRNKEYLTYAAEVLLDIENLPEQGVVLEELWERPFPMYIASRGFGKSFLLAEYAMLRCALIPGTKIVIVGAAFRQSKVIFEYMVNIWNNSPILRSICDQGSGPKSSPDRCIMHINDSWAMAVPLGDGSKIRGLRAHTIMADEFASIPPDIFETVVRGFTAVSAKPVDNVKAAAKRRYLKDIGKWTPKSEVMYGKRRVNQVIISGTADYDFKHYAEYWRRYKKIIASKDRPEKLKEIFGDDDIPENFSHKDFSVIRIPYELIPEGFMDDKQVAQAKATVHSGIYQMEYGACHSKCSPVTTDKGVKNIEDVNVGDRVLTHKGRFQPVTKKMYRNYDGMIYTYKTLGCNQEYKVTTDHPFWYGEDRFESLHEDNTCLVNINELEGNYELPSSSCCTNYLETFDGNRYYPRSSQSKITLQEQRRIRSKCKAQKEFAKEYNLKQSAISYIQTDKRIPKNSIPSQLKLDYNLGLIIGYYASEGSIGANNTQVSFALDEHKDTEYQKQLLKAIRKVFGFHGKKYIKQKNTVEICVNSRLVAEVMKYICPGLSHDKLIRHEIMFANEECLRGIIEGYWNGDGHLGENHMSAHCSNLSLVNQIRIGLSYFNISSTISSRKDGSCDLTSSGENYRNFLAEFYDKPNLTIGSGLIRNNQGMSILPIIDKSTEHYKGLVYNLEVEEDHSYSTLNATSHNCFTTDSDGFFRRSMIEACVTNKPVKTSSGDVQFDALVEGNHGYEYVYGVDPASENDNFSIVIVEMREDHNRVVYSWTTTRKDFVQRKKKGLTEVADFYGFCARKIRDLMKVFPTQNICIDAQGGGIAVMEALHDPAKLNPGERLLWPVIDEDKEQITDDESGDHFLHMIQFANYDWTSKANHGLRKDMEDRALLFPRFDGISIAMATDYDQRMNKVYDISMFDSMEDCIMEIEELKSELCTITHTRTGTGVNSRDRWDTPEIVLPNGRKGRMRKDRYSSLVMANMVARSLSRETSPVRFGAVGGFARDLANQRTNQSTTGIYAGAPKWLQEGAGGSPLFGVINKNKRRGV